MLCTGMMTIAFHCSTAGSSTDSADSAREDRLRAGYLFNFAKFIEWPDFTPEEPLTVCFLGSPGTQAAFDAGMGGKSIGTHRVVTREVKSRPASSGCRMMFVAASFTAAANFSSGNIEPALLTVGDAPDFLARGGIIELFTQDNHLRFNVSIDNARQASLRIGSDLLQLAAQVEDKKQ